MIPKIKTKRGLIVFLLMIVLAVIASGYFEKTGKELKSSLLGADQDYLQGHWKMDGNENDSSINRYHASLDPGGSSTPSWQDGGVDGSKAFFVNGMQSLNADLRQSPKNITVSVWIKQNGSLASPRNMAIAGNKSMGLREPGFILYLNEQNLLVFEIGTSTRWLSAIMSKTYTETVTDGKWHLITGTYDSTPVNGKLTLFVDGKPEGFGPALLSGETVAPFPSKFFIGKYKELNDVSDLNSFFIGSLDDLRVYNYALSQEEVDELYLLPKEILYLPFEEGEGTAQVKNADGITVGTLRGGKDGVNGAALNQQFIKGPFGKALQLKGNTEGGILHLPANTVDFSTGKIYTIAFWMNVPLGSSTSAVPFSKFSSERKWDLSLSNMRNYGSFFQFNYMPGTVAATFGGGASDEWFNRWQHFALVIDSGQSKIKVYNGGSRVPMVMPSNNTNISLQTTLFSNIPLSLFSNASNSFDGYIDEIRIFDRELSPTEYYSVWLGKGSKIKSILNPLCLDSSLLTQKKATCYGDTPPLTIDGPTSNLWDTIDTKYSFSFTIPESQLETLPHSFQISTSPNSSISSKIITAGECQISDSNLVTLTKGRVCRGVIRTTFKSLGEHWIKAVVTSSSAGAPSFTLPIQVTGRYSLEKNENTYSTNPIYNKNAIGVNAVIQKFDSASKAITIKASCENLLSENDYRVPTVQELIDADNQDNPQGSAHPYLGTFGVHFGDVYQGGQMSSCIYNNPNDPTPYANRSDQKSFNCRYDKINPEKTVQIINSKRYERSATFMWFNYWSEGDYKVQCLFKAIDSSKPDIFKNIFVRFQQKYPVCGNRAADPNEECDDGNTTSGDGCSSICLKEARSSCNQTLIDQVNQCDIGLSSTGGSDGFSIIPRETISADTALDANIPATFEPITNRVKAKGMKSISLKTKTRVPRENAKITITALDRLPAEVPAISAGSRTVPIVQVYDISSDPLLAGPLDEATIQLQTSRAQLRSFGIQNNADVVLGHFVNAKWESIPPVVIPAEPSNDADPIIFSFITKSFSPFALTSTFEASCGNNAVEGTEQCDDGNLTNDDGCSSLCKDESITPAWRLDPITTSSAIRSVSGTNDSNVFGVGQNGTIFHFNGQTWSKHAVNTTETFTGVWSSSVSNAYAVTLEGSIYHYNGREWIKSFKGPSERYHALWGFDAKNIYLAGDILGSSGFVRHYDGYNWTKLENEPSLHGEAFWGTIGSDGKKHLFLVGGPQVTHFDGTTWKYENLGSYGIFNGIWGSSLNDIYVTSAYGNPANTAIFHFDGSSWQKLFANDPALGEWPTTIWGSGPNNFFVTGQNQISHFDGTTWSVELSGAGMSGMNTIWGTDAKNVFSFASTPNGKAFYRYRVLTASGGGLCGNSTKETGEQCDDGNLKNADGCSEYCRDETLLPSWKKTDLSSSAIPVKIWGTSLSNAFAVGRYGTILFFNGKDWVKQSTGTTSAFFKDVWGISRSNAYAVTAEGAIYQYNGFEWKKIFQAPSGSNERYNALWGFDETDVYVAGDIIGGTGFVLHYDGTNWVKLSEPETQIYGQAMWGTIGPDQKKHLFIATNAQIMHFDGSSWGAEALGANGNFSTIWGTGLNDIYATSTYWNPVRTAIFHFDGSSWKKLFIDELQLGEYPTGIWATGPNDIFVAGQNQIAHFDGSSWSVQLSGIGIGGVNALWGVNAKHVFSFGTSPDGYSSFRYSDPSSAPNAICGNNQKELDEMCDDGNTVNDDSCSNTCAVKLTSCGDGTVDTGEQCDDGNTTAGDGCSASCQIEIRCGDGVKNGDEACDGTAGIDVSQHQSCKADCSAIEILPWCGDGIKNGSEQCDTSGDSQTCSVQCQNKEYCGDGIKNGNEECDAGQNGNAICTAQCKDIYEPVFIITGDSSAVKGETKHYRYTIEWRKKVLQNQ